LNTADGGPFAGLKGAVTDSSGSEFLPVMSSISGIAFTALQDGYIFQATEIKPNDSITPTIKFVSHASRQATSGSCRLQLEFLIGQSFSGATSPARLQNIVTKIAAQ